MDPNSHINKDEKDVYTKAMAMENSKHVINGEITFEAMLDTFNFH